MEELNKILNDESHNDKQLIKELSVYVRNHRDKGLPINKNFYIDIINIVLRNSEVDFNEINFNENTEYDWDSEWYSDDLILYVKITKILNKARYNKNHWFAPIGLKVDKRLVEYYESISVIIHEFTHARQDYVKKYLNNIIYDSCDNFIEEHYEEYSYYHDEILIERYANLRGSIIAYKVLSYIYPLNYVAPFRMSIIAWLILEYKINNQGNVEQISLQTPINKDSILISPIDSYNSVMEENCCDKTTIEINENMTLYDKLYLGLPITKEECNKLKTIIKDIIEYVPSNNDYSDVKRLINRM